MAQASTHWVLVELCFTTTSSVIRMTTVLVPPCRSCGWRPDADEFWSGRMSARDNDEAREKYKRVVALERMAEEERRPALRAVARRWPGALREAELVSPEAMAARTEAARGLVAGEPRRGGGAPREAVTLWHALHHLLRDQRTLRLESGGRSEEVSVDRLVAQDVEGAEREDRARRWPEAQHLRALTGANVRPRQAYLWLAAQTSLSLAGLHAKLFRRAGRWDLRDDDPPWSRDPSVSG